MNLFNDKYDDDESGDNHDDSRAGGPFDLFGGGAIEAADIHSQRSRQAQAVDERKRAPVTDDLDEWEERPDELDFEGVDTPKQRARNRFWRWEG